MAIEKFCDREPCHWMKKFVENFLPKGRELATFKEGSFGLVQLDVLRRQKREDDPLKAPGRVTFWYCPFCGTRLLENGHVLGWIDARMRGLR